MDEAFRPDVNPRLNRIDKIALLTQCPLFASLSHWELVSLSHSVRLVEYKKGEVVYAEGEEAASFYVIVSGRFEEFLWRQGVKKLLAYFKSQDHFGEIALLTGQAHSATVQALSDSLVFELKKNDFHNVFEHKAKVSFELSRRLGGRLKSSDPQAESLSRNDIVAVFRDDLKSGRLCFPVNLAACLATETQQKVILLHLVTDQQSRQIAGYPSSKVFHLKQVRSIENELGGVLEKYAVSHPGGFEELLVTAYDHDAQTIENVIRLLNMLVVHFRFLVFSLNATMDELILKTMSHADLIFFLTDSQMDSMTRMHETVEELKKSNLFSDHPMAIVLEEALLGGKSLMVAEQGFFSGLRLFKMPTYTLIGESDERSERPFVLEHPEDAYSRAVRHVGRFVSRNLVGLVLGSGAALGLSHIGVLKVIEREKIPIDVIAGSSIGAFIGALYALGMTAQEIERDTLRELSSLWKIWNLIDVNIFPVRGILHGDQVLKLFRKYLKNKTFEDCQTPLRIVAANLSTWELVIFDRGLVSEAVKASIAIPGIFKPSISGNHVIVDGGIFSPLPIRTLRQMGVNKIIAVNVFPSSLHVRQRRLIKDVAWEEERLKWAQKNKLAQTWWRMKKKLSRCFYPNIFDILMNTIQAMESEISDVEAEEADILIRPVIPEAGWVEFYKPGQFVQKGEREAEQMLPKIRELVNQQSG